jgi:tRNA threonylcarbamoyladenosine biosynthesis protein TsaE
MSAGGAGDASMHARRLESPAATQRLAAALGRLVEPGQVIALVGDLGAGKTCFVQGLARGLGVPREERVASPTFNIVLEHRGRLPLYHVDLYRIASPDELPELGLESIFAGEGVSAVEWMDRHPELAPADHLELRLSIAGPRERRIEAIPHGPRSQELVERWLGSSQAGS